MRIILFPLVLFFISLSLMLNSCEQNIVDVLNDTVFVFDTVYDTSSFYGFVEGYISKDSQSIGNAAIEIFVADYTSGQYRKMDKKCITSSVLSTDSGGYYRLNLIEGNYRLKFYNYRSYLEYNVHVYSDTTVILDVNFDLSVVSFPIVATSENKRILLTWDVLSNHFQEKYHFIYRSEDSINWECVSTRNKVIYFSGKGYEGYYEDTVSTYKKYYYRIYPYNNKSNVVGKSEVVSIIPHYSQPEVINVTIIDSVDFIYTIGVLDIGHDSYDDYSVLVAYSNDIGEKLEIIDTVSVTMNNNGIGEFTYKNNELDTGKHYFNYATIHKNKINVSKWSNIYSFMYEKMCKSINLNISKRWDIIKLNIAVYGMGEDIQPGDFIVIHRSEKGVEYLVPLDTIDISFSGVSNWIYYDQNLGQDTVYYQVFYYGYYGTQILNKSKIQKVFTPKTENEIKFYSVTDNGMFVTLKYNTNSLKQGYLVIFRKDYTDQIIIIDTIPSHSSVSNSFDNIPPYEGLFSYAMQGFSNENLPTDTSDWVDVYFTKTYKKPAKPNFVCSTDGYAIKVEIQSHNNQPDALGYIINRLSPDSSIYKIVDTITIPFLTGSFLYYDSVNVKGKYFYYISAFDNRGGVTVSDEKTICYSGLTQFLKMPTLSKNSYSYFIKIDFINNILKEGDSISIYRSSNDPNNFVHIHSFQYEMFSTVIDYLDDLKFIGSGTYFYKARYKMNGEYSEYTPYSAIYFDGILARPSKPEFWINNNIVNLSFNTKNQMFDTIAIYRSQELNGEYSRIDFLFSQSNTWYLYCEDTLTVSGTYYYKTRYFSGILKGHFSKTSIVSFSDTLMVRPVANKPPGLPEINDMSSLQNSYRLPGLIREPLWENKKEGVNNGTK